MLPATAGEASGAEQAQRCAELERGPARTVVRVLDGETVALDDGSQLRLIGALAPRAIDVDAEPGAWPTEAGAVRSLRDLVLGKSIDLRFAGARTDRYGRLQAHAFVIEGGARRWVQGELLQLGLARAYLQAGNAACAEALMAAEQEARSERRGLWADAAYQVRPAHKRSELLRYRATFQIVEGRIRRVAEVRGTIYLNFARNWRQGFSASLRRDDRALLGSFASHPRGLAGRNVRVRGWIEQRGAAPVIDLSAAGAVEVLSEAGEEAQQAP